MYGRKRRKTAGRARFDEDVSEGQFEADSRDEPSRLPASILRAVTQSSECRKPTALLGAALAFLGLALVLAGTVIALTATSESGHVPSHRGRFESGPRVTRRIVTRCAFV